MASGSICSSMARYPLLPMDTQPLNPCKWCCRPNCATAADTSLAVCEIAYFKTDISSTVPPLPTNTLRLCGQDQTITILTNVFYESAPYLLQTPLPPAPLVVRKLASIAHGSTRLTPNPLHGIPRLCSMWSSRNSVSPFLRVPHLQYKETLPNSYPLTSIHSSFQDHEGPLSMARSRYDNSREQGSCATSACYITLNCNLSCNMEILTRLTPSFIFIFSLSFYFSQILYFPSLPQCLVASQVKRTDLPLFFHFIHSSSSSWAPLSHVY